MRNPLSTSEDPKVSLSIVDATSSSSSAIDSAASAVGLGSSDTFQNFIGGSIKLTMEQLANSFELEWVSNDGDPNIYRGDRVELSLGEDKILVGHVYSVSEDDSPDFLTRSASGFSVTGDLLDCSAIHKPGRWNHATLSDIAGELVAPFGIQVIVVGNSGAPFPTFAITRGESVYDVITRLCAKRGLIPYCVDDTLVIAKIGTSRSKTVLERGKNVVRWSRTDSDYERYSTYRYLSQIKPATEYGKPANQVFAEIEDKGVTRYRPLLVQAEAHDTIDITNRAKLERNQRAGQGERLTVTVNEWFDDSGNAWRPNTLVRAKNELLGVDADLLIVSATFRFGADVPREVDLELAHPAAFDSESNYPTRKRAAKWT